MYLQYNITYTKCSFCTSKVNCSVCEKEILETLRPMEIKHPKVNMLAKTLSLETEMDEDELLDHLESVGIFA